MKSSSSAGALPASPLGRARDPADGCGHILLVEDDFGVQNIVAEVLRTAGYRVECANDGETAWQALCRERFDLLITDHDMPGLTGLELLRRVRASQRDLPAIMISGKMPWEVTDLFTLLPPGAAMEKPFPLAELLTKVRRLVNT